MHENVQKLEEKRRAKFPATTLGYSIVKIARLGDAFSDIFKLEASPVEGPSLPHFVHIDLSLVSMRPFSIALRAEP